LEGTNDLHEATETLGYEFVSGGDLIDGYGNVVNLTAQQIIELAEAQREAWAAADTGDIARATAWIEDLGDAAAAAEAAQARWNAEFAKITSVEGNFKGIISFAEQYDVIMGDINTKQARLDELMGIIETGGGYLDGAWVSTYAAKEEVELLTGEIETLEQSMDRMAKQMVLDMLLAAIEIEGATTETMQAYFDLADEYGILSKEASDKAIEAAQNAADEVGEVLDWINNYQIADKSYTITKYRKTVIIEEMRKSVGSEPQKASGGPVAANRPYIVGERGPELFVPSQSGRIEPNHRLGNMSGGSGGVTIVYSPQMSFATEEEIRMRFVPLVEKAMRQVQGF